MPRGKRNGKDKDQTVKGAGIEHNSVARKEVIRECSAAFREIQKQRQEMNEEAGGIRKRLRDCGIDVPSFMAVLRIADKEDEARDTYLDGLREAFEALGIGAQVDMFTHGGDAEQAGA